MIVHIVTMRHWWQKRKRHVVYHHSIIYLYFYVFCNNYYLFACIFSLNVWKILNVLIFTFFIFILLIHDKQLILKEHKVCNAAIAGQILVPGFKKQSQGQIIAPSGEWVSCELSNSITHAWTQTTLSLVPLLQKGEKFPKTEIWKKQNMGRQEIWVIIPAVGSPSLLFILDLGFLLGLNVIWKWGVFSYHKYAISWFPFLLISLSKHSKKLFNVKTFSFE